MRDLSRIARMADILLDIWEAAPDLRLGQLIDCAHQLEAGDPARQPGIPDIFSIEDDRMETGLRLLREEVRKSCQSV